jgi:hypothetical protein
MGTVVRVIAWKGPGKASVSKVAAKKVDADKVTADKETDATAEKKANKTTYVVAHDNGAVGEFPSNAKYLFGIDDEIPKHILDESLEDEKTPETSDAQ